MRDQLFRLSENSHATLQVQVREMLVSAILDEHIAADNPVPSCRQLARQLGISRNTIVLAYQQLVDEGYLVSRERSGYYVNGDILSGRVAYKAAPHAPPVGAPDWESRFTSKPSAQRNVVKPYNWRQYRYPFIYGQFDQSMLPIADWRQCCREALAVQAIRDWAGDGVDRDDPLLIKEIHTRILPRRGVWASPDEILITVGAQQALYLLANLLVTGRHIGIEDPGYVDARNIFCAKTSQVSGLPVDEQGLIVDERLDACDYIYVTPSHQYPTTVTMTLARRQALLERAMTSDFVLIEDDYESEVNYVGEATPALKSLDTHDRVIYVGSLSKTLAPGLRLGYMVGSKSLIREARALRRLMLRHPPANNERTVALFLARGHHDSLLRRLSQVYRERWQLIGELLDRYLPESTRVPTFGGTSYWVKGPVGLNAIELQRRAEEHSLLIEAGDIYFLSSNPPLNYFRLGFASIPTERIEAGIKLLAELIDTA